ncbi:MAG TPA: SpoIID/LytB domain-containing protein [Chroococcales cyanobacterium]
MKLSIEQIEPTDKTDSPTDETELVAAVQAVISFMDAEMGERAGFSTEFGGAPSRWQTVSRLESVGLSPAKSVWRRSLGFGSCLLAFLFTAILTCPPSLATAELEGDEGGSTSTLIDSPEPDWQNMPKAAPPRLAPPAAAFKPAPSYRARIPALPPSARTVLRVGLALGVSSVNIDAPDGATVQDVVSGDTVATLPARSQWSVKFAGGSQLAFTGRRAGDGAQLIAQSSGKIKPAGYTPMAAPLLRKFSLSQSGSAALTGGYVIVPKAQPDGSGSQVVVLNGRLYRGSMWLKPTSPQSDASPVSAINLVDLEDYLLSVLPSEMPSSWPVEALKAQAIAARSYACANLGKHGKDGYDLKATVEDQVYSGVSSENESTCRAVAETAGIVLKYEDKPVSAFFHSTSGGSTELAENVWGRKVPYLKAVPDYDDASPHFSWVRRFTGDEVERALGPDYAQLTALTVVSRNPSSRVREVLVTNGNQTHIVSGETFRKILHLPSSNFNVGYKDSAFEFAGRGSGHGLGMSQYGARALANQGYNAAQILTYYYKDVSVDYLTQLQSTGI